MKKFAIWLIGTSAITSIIFLSGFSMIPAVTYGVVFSTIFTVIGSQFSTKPTQQTHHPENDDTPQPVPLLPIISEDDCKLTGTSPQISISTSYNLTPEHTSEHKQKPEQEAEKQDGVSQIASDDVVKKARKKQTAPKRSKATNRKSSPAVTFQFETKSKRRPSEGTTTSSSCKKNPTSTNTSSVQLSQRPVETPKPAKFGINYGYLGQTHYVDERARRRHPFW